MYNCAYYYLLYVCLCLCLLIHTGANAETFKVAMKLEAEELAGTPFGATLVTAIGTSYSEFAHQVQSSFDNLSIGMAQTGRNLSTKYTIASASISAAVAAQKAEKLKKKGMADGREALSESVAMQVSDGAVISGNHSVSLLCILTAVSCHY